MRNKIVAIKLHITIAALISLIRFQMLMYLDSIHYFYLEHKEVLLKLILLMQTQNWVGIKDFLSFSSFKENLKFKLCWYLEKESCERLVEMKDYIN